MLRFYSLFVAAVVASEENGGLNLLQMQSHRHSQHVQLEPVVGVIKTNVCPEGSEKIASEEDCQSASAALGYKYLVTGVDKRTKRPGGCYFNKKGKSFFNDNVAGGAAYKQATPLCMKPTTTTTTIALVEEWRCLDFWDAYPGCQNRKNVNSHAQCQAEAEAGGFQGFGLIASRECCLKKFDVADLKRNMVPDKRVQWCYRFKGIDPLPDFADLDQKFKCYNKEDAWPGCNDVGYFKSKNLCKQEAMIKGFQGFGLVMSNSQCCLKNYNPEDLQSNLIKDDNVEFCDWQANHPR